MRYGQIRKFDIANGEGIRTSLFVTGCSHHCPHCFNEEYQNPAAGSLFDDQAMEELFSYIHHPQSVGLTLLGGEPMENVEGLLPVVQRFRKETDKTLWIYSGYIWEQILADPLKTKLLKYADVLVDGPFIEEQKNLKLAFRGSENQRIIDVQKSLTDHDIILYMH